MLSGRELFEHVCFSGLATICIISGLLAAKNISLANDTYINNRLLVSKLLISLGATLILAGLLLLSQKVGLRVGYFTAIFFVYLPALASLAWAIKVYIRGVLPI